jgi:hypothetical protein
MFWPKWTSSVVEVAMIKEFAAHCNAVLFLLCGCLGLLPVMWVNHLFYLGVLELHIYLMVLFGLLAAAVMNVVPYIHCVISAQTSTDKTLFKRGILFRGTVIFNESKLSVQKIVT